jgi:hypothetical protein
MRRHIAKALKSRSQAVKNAIEKFNNTSQRLRPPGPTIDWEEAVEYTFLAEFDLLREGRQDVREKPWASPTGRIALDRFFKIRRAYEEIERLNIEICRLLTFICDEETELQQKEKELTATNKPLAFQIAIYRQDRSRFNRKHIQRLVKLSKVPGFSGKLTTGVFIERGAEAICSQALGLDDVGSDSSDDEDSVGEAEDEHVVATEAALSILEASDRAT